MTRTNERGPRSQVAGLLAILMVILSKAPRTFCSKM